MKNLIAYFCVGANLVNAYSSNKRGGASLNFYLAIALAAAFIVLSAMGD